MELTPLEKEMVESDQIFVAEAQKATHRAWHNERAGRMLAEKLCTAIGVPTTSADALWNSALLDTEEA